MGGLLTAMFEEGRWLLRVMWESGWTVNSHVLGRLDGSLRVVSKGGSGSLMSRV